MKLPTSLLLPLVTSVVILSSFTKADDDASDCLAQCFVDSIDTILAEALPAAQAKLSACAVLSTDPGTYTVNDDLDPVVSGFNLDQVYSQFAAFLPITEGYFGEAYFEETLHSIDFDSQSEVQDDVILYPGTAEHKFNVDALVALGTQVDCTTEGADPIACLLVQLGAACTAACAGSLCVLESTLTYQMTLVEQDDRRRLNIPESSSEEDGSCGDDEKIGSVAETLLGTVVGCKASFGDSFSVILFPQAA